MSRLLDPSTVSTRLADVAPLIDAVEAVVELDESSWGLAFEGLSECLLELEGAGAVLTASIDIGTPVDGRGERVHAAALTYNALWRETRGMRIVQAGETGELMLVQQFAADAVYADDFGPALDELGHVATWWRAYVSHDGADEQSLEIAPSGMRV
jgi:hypothetical protein